MVVVNIKGKSVHCFCNNNNNNNNNNNDDKGYIYCISRAHMHVLRIEK